MLAAQSGATVFEIAFAQWIRESETGSLADIASDVGAKLLNWNSGGDQHRSPAPAHRVAVRSGSRGRAKLGSRGGAKLGHGAMGLSGYGLGDLAVTDVLRRRIGAAVIERAVGPRARAPDSATAYRRGRTRPRGWTADSARRPTTTAPCRGAPSRRSSCSPGTPAGHGGGRRHRATRATVDACSGQATSLWAMMFGRQADARAAYRPRPGHRRAAHRGCPDGLPYAASDPDLLTWVHVADIYAFRAAPTSGTAASRSTRPGAMVTWRTWPGSPRNWAGWSPRTETEAIGIFIGYARNCAGRPRPSRRPVPAAGAAPAARPAAGLRRTGRRGRRPAAALGAARSACPGGRFQRQCCPAAGRAAVKAIRWGLS